MKIKINKNKYGFSLVEVLVAVAIFALLAAGVFQVVTNSYSNFYGTGDRQAITEFAEEGAEAVRAIRDASWQDIEDIPLDYSAGVEKVNGAWALSGVNSRGSLYRSVAFLSVYRDVDGNIVDTGGTLDPLSRKVKVTVFANGMDDYILEFYITNWSTKKWLQTDWSGSDSRQFWSEIDMANTITDISTSTQGEVELAGENYSASKKIVINNKKVEGSSSLLNFPVLISETINSLKTTSHGGQVTSDDGYDIIFTSDILGNTQLDHEIESYASSTGEIIMWVEIPTIDYDEDTTFYMYYGNSEITTSQEDVSGTWASNYVTVLHMSEDPSISTDGDCGGVSKEVCDSTTNNNDADSSGMASGDLIDAQIGKGLDFDGNNDFLTVDDSSSLDSATGASQSRTISFWLNLDNPNDNELITDKTGFNGNHFWIQTSDKGGSSGDLLAGVSAGGKFLNSNPAIGTDSWRYISMTHDSKSSESTLYVDGQISSGPLGQSPPVDDNDDLLIGGDGSSNGVDAIFDELRVSNYIKTQSWLETEYNNQSSPESFYYIGPNDDFAYRQQITIDSDEVDGTANFSDYAFLMTTTSDAFKTRTHGGKIANDNGYDIIFSSDSAGATQLDHEIESYSSSTGEIVMWVGLPTLDYDDDTILYMHYSSSTIFSSLEDSASLWSDYSFVYHLGEPAGTTGTDSVTDSTGNTAGTPSSGLVFGTSSKAGTAVDFSSGSGTGISLGTIGSSVLTPTTTISFWANVYNYASPVRQNAFAHAYGGWGTMNVESSGQNRFYMGSSGYNSSPYSSFTANSFYTNNEWVYVTAVRDPANLDYLLYRNGSLFYSSTTYSASYPVINNNTFYIGDGYVNAFNGAIDEFRIKNDVLSVDEIATEYNNMNSPEDFFSMSNETEILGDGTIVGGYDTPGTIVSSIYDLGSSDQNISTIRVEQSVPTSCSIEITLKTDDNADCIVLYKGRDWASRDSNHDKFLNFTTGVYIAEKP